MKKSLPALASLFLLALPARSQEWPQWGRDPQHTGSINVTAQSARHILEDVVYDPLVEAEKADPFAEGDLLVHYQVPLVDGDDVFMELKSGTYTNIFHWQTQTWNEKRLHWERDHLVVKWAFTSDWKPEPFATVSSGPIFEPVFHAALAGDVIYIPGFGGSVFKVRKADGALQARISPFGSHLDQDTFVAGPLSVDGAGNVYYNAIKLNHGQTWDADVVNSWLVKIAPNGSVRTATYASLTPGAPAGTDLCLSIFDESQLPWPPSRDATPPQIPCGSQRPGLNVAPAIAPDGTIYTFSVAQFSDRTAYLVAVTPDLRPKWKASLRDRLNDGCNVLLPPNGTPGGCRTGSRTGVDPAQNRPGAGRIIDDASTSPTIAPDGSILVGTYTRYNYAQGHLMKFSANGTFQGAYRFGWDITPAIRVHDGTYSILMKDNQYGEVGSYCNDDTLCPPDRTANHPSFPEAYYITSLSKNLVTEWRWRNTNTLSCSRDASGHVTCVDDHPAGFEWCVNAPAIDRNGRIYNNSEDGNLYVLNPDGSLRETLFLETALGAAYTPLSIGDDGRIYTQNDGHLFVVGR